MGSLKNVIAIFSASKLSSRDLVVFGGEYYKMNGFKVVFLSLHKIFYPGKDYINVAGGDTDYMDFILHEPSDFNDLALLLSIYSPTLQMSVGYIDFASPNINILKLLRLSRVFNIPLVFYHGGAIPITLIDDQKSLTERVFRKIAFFVYFNFLGFLGFLGFLTRLRVVLGAKVNNLFLENRFIPCQKFYAHTLDYEVAKFNMPAHNSFDHYGKYAVFLDEFAPFHPDNELIFGKNLEDYAIGYYSRLNNFFDIVESNGYQVVIAAHPRSRYSETAFEWCFNGRQVLKNKTAELVKNCSFCIGHLSTSFNYAVMFDKPILQLNSKFYRDVPEYLVAFDSVKKELGLDCIDIDASDISFRKPSIDRIKYNRYMEMYIKTKGSPDKSIYEIFLEASGNDFRE